MEIVEYLHKLPSLHADLVEERGAVMGIASHGGLEQSQKHNCHKIYKQMWKPGMQEFGSATMSTNGGVSLNVVSYRRVANMLHTRKAKQNSRRDGGEWQFVGCLVVVQVLARNVRLLVHRQSNCVCLCVHVCVWVGQHSPANTISTTTIMAACRDAGS